MRQIIEKHYHQQQRDQMSEWKENRAINKHLSKRQTPFARIPTAFQVGNREM